MKLHRSNRLQNPVSTLMRWLFTGSATLTIFALGMIVFLLFRESFGFFPEYGRSLALYRTSGLEYVDLKQKRYDRFIRIDHELIELRAEWIREMERLGLDPGRREALLHEGPKAELFAGYRTAAGPLRDYLAEQREIAIKRKAGRPGSDRPPDPAVTERLLRHSLPTYEALLLDLQNRTEALFEGALAAETNWPRLARGIRRLAEKNAAFHAGREMHWRELASWSAARPVQGEDAFRAFFLGSEWVTASDQHNWYGLLPLLSGSLLVAAIALALAVPLGVGAAVYVNLLAGPRERSLLKPGIEFIAALPAVVVGFFGVMVFGELVRLLSRSPLVDWLPFFEVQERLNAFTAGALLALMAIPTIFTLTEDALFGVGKEVKAASFAMGATRLQTAFRVVIPSALGGIVSAVLLGFGRVIGETMIVLLCAGNRVRIPEFSEGLSVVFDPSIP